MEQTQSESIVELAKALVLVQAEIEPSHKTEQNFYGKNYSNLRAVWDCCRSLLTQNGLAVTQTNGGTAESPSVITTLMHTSGEWIRGELTMTPEKKGPQGTGSCITYARRYALAAIIGIYQEDDDAEGATKRGKKDKATKDTSKAGVDDIPLGDPQKSENADLTDPERKAKGLISKAQRKRLQTIAGTMGWPAENVKDLLKENDYSSSHDIKWQDYKKIVEKIEALDMSVK